MPRLLGAWHHEPVGSPRPKQEASERSRDMKIGQGHKVTPKPIFELNRHATLFSGVTPRTMKIRVGLIDLESYFRIKPPCHAF
jgi:hypothetical protein